MDEHIKQKVFKIIESEINIKLSDFDFEKDIREQITLDSVQLVGITAKLEESLGIQLPITVLEVSTFNEFLKIVEKELQNS